MGIRILKGDFLFFFLSDGRMDECGKTNETNVFLNTSYRSAQPMKKKLKLIFLPSIFFPHPIKLSSHFDSLYRFIIIVVTAKPRPLTRSWTTKEAKLVRTNRKAGGNIIGCRYSSSKRPTDRPRKAAITTRTSFRIPTVGRLRHFVLEKLCQSEITSSSWKAEEAFAIITDRLTQLRSSIGRGKGNRSKFLR